MPLVDIRIVRFYSPDRVIVRPLLQLHTWKAHVILCLHEGRLSLLVVAGKAKLAAGIAHFQQLIYTITVMNIMAGSTLHFVTKKHI